MDQLLDVAKNLEIDYQMSQLTFILKHMYDCFIERDIEILDINPLLMGMDQKLYVNAAKIKIDQYSIYRQ